MGGDHEDPAIPRDLAVMYLREDEHFHSGLMTGLQFTIIVNAEEKVVHTSVLTYAEVVAFAYANPPTGPNVIITVLFKHAAGPIHEGTLSAGESVRIKNGTVFNVRISDKS